MTEPLTQTEKEAAVWLAEGVNKTEIGDRLGKTRSAVRVLEKRPEFVALVARTRAALEPEGEPDEPILRRADRRRKLEQIASKTNADGTPTYSAEKAILNLEKFHPEDDERDDGTHIIERVRIYPSDADHAEVIELLETTPLDVNVAVAREDGSGEWRILANRTVPGVGTVQGYKLTGPPSRPSEPEVPTVPAVPPPTDEPTRDAG